MSRVLVADDDAINREIARRMLSRLGMEVDEVAEGRAALAAVEAALAGGRDYDFIFLDISMPGIDGYEVCRQLRAGGSGARLFAFSGSESGSESAAAGFDAFLQKPLTFEKLRSALEK